MKHFENPDNSGKFRKIPEKFRTLFNMLNSRGNLVQKSRKNSMSNQTPFSAHCALKQCAKATLFIFWRYKQVAFKRSKSHFHPFLITLVTLCQKIRWIKFRNFAVSQFSPTFEKMKILPLLYDLRYKMQFLELLYCILQLL